MSKQSKALSSQSLEELTNKVTEIDKQMFKLRMQLATGQLSNTAALRNTRKELARIKTFRAQKLRASEAGRTNEQVKGK